MPGRDAMAITTLDGLIAASKQSLQFLKTGARTTVAAIWFSLFELAGMPGASTLAGSSAPPRAWCQTIRLPAVQDSLTLLAVLRGTSPASSSATPSRVACVLSTASSKPARTPSTLQALSSQPSWSARAPGGSYIGFEIWIEAVTAFTGIPTIAITYTNQDGTAGRTTGAISSAWR